MSMPCKGLWRASAPWERFKSLGSIRDLIRFVLQVGRPTKLSTVSTTTHDLMHVESPKSYKP